MNTLLPDDLEIERLLVPVRVAVMDATQHVRSSRHSTRYRTARTLIFAGAAIAMLTAGAIVVAIERQTVIDHTAHCFEHASLDSRDLMAQGITGADGNKLDPVAACSVLWSTGAFTAGNDETVPNPGDSPVPDLFACTYSDGIAAVFPREGTAADGTDFCAALSLADWGSD